MKKVLILCTAFIIISSLQVLADIGNGASCTRQNGKLVCTETMKFVQDRHGNYRYDDSAERQRAKEEKQQAKEMKKQAKKLEKEYKEQMKNADFGGFNRDRSRSYTIYLNK